VTQQINLFNPIFLRQKKYFSIVTILQMLALVLVGMLTFYAYAVYQTNRLSAEVAETSGRLEQEKNRFAKANAELGPHEKNQDLDAQVKALEKQLKNREDILGVQAGVAAGKGRGFSEALLALARQSVNGVWLTSISVGGETSNKMVIDGRALRPDMVPDYIKRLSKEKAMRGQTFSVLNMQLSRMEKSANNKGPEGYFEFNLRSAEPESKESKE
jgi:Tfp pilus assembly protein PilN